jgi:hypothetical protein
MATWDDVRRIALELPETSEVLSRGLRQWRVKDKLFVWERPLRRKEVESLPASAPAGPILAARVEHVGAKEALLAEDPSLFFTTAHFDGYPAILVRLPRIASDQLRELVTEAWLARAPRPLARAYLAGPR